MSDYRAVANTTLGEANENAINLVERIDLELRIDLPRGYESQNIDEIGGIVVRGPDDGHLLEQHLNRIALNGLSAHSGCDETATRT